MAVVIHGGFWRARYGRKLMRPLCRDLAARGWAAWNVEYRRLGRVSGGGWPTTFADVGARDRPPGGDPHRRAAGPRPRGGDRPLGRRPPGRVGGRATRAPRGRAGRGAARAGHGRGRPGRRRRPPAGVGAAALRAASSATCSAAAPEEYGRRATRSPPRPSALPLGVPVLLTHGGRDDIVPPSISAALRRDGAGGGRRRSSPWSCAGEDHFGHIDPANPLWAAVVQWLA